MDSSNRQNFYRRKARARLVNSVIALGLGVGLFMAGPSLMQWLDLPPTPAMKGLIIAIAGFVGCMGLASLASSARYWSLSFLDNTGPIRHGFPVIPINPPPPEGSITNSGPKPQPAEKFSAERPDKK